MQYAHTLLRLQRLDAALSLIEELLPAARAQMHSELRALGLAHVQVLTDLGRREQARAALVDVETQYAALRKDKRYPARAFAFTQAHWALAAEDVALARAALDEARAIVEAAGQADDPAWHQVHQLQARLHLARGQAADALEHAEAALARSQRQAVEPDASFRIAEDLLLRAQARHALDDRAGANADAAAALRHAREAAGAEHPLVHRANAQSLR